MHANHIETPFARHAGNRPLWSRGANVQLSHRYRCQWICPDTLPVGVGMCWTSPSQAS